MSVAHYQSPLQRKYLKNVRQQLKKRSAKGEKDITIRYVSSIPKIVATKPKKPIGLTTQQKSMLIVYLKNVNGLTTKLNQLRTSSAALNYDILVLVDTNLGKNVRNSEHYFTKHSVFRSELTSNKESGGGVLIVVYTNMQVIRHCTIGTNHEVFVLILKLESGSSLLLCGAYILS